jgi:SIR2-like domain
MIDLDLHYKTVAKAMLEGRVVPFLGAGVNLCGRPHGVPFQLGESLPSGGELAVALAADCQYPTEGKSVECPHCHETHDVQYPLDLLKVSQHMTVMTGSGPLYEKLRAVFNADYPPTALHVFLAHLPGLMRESHREPRYQLIITTNYDDVLERAFQDAGEPFDLVAYVADGEHRGKFWHQSPDGTNRIVDVANNYEKVSTEQRTVIMKIHGAVDRATAEKDSYVITEDHYIDFLTRTDISGLVPVLLNEKMRKSHFLFLGYGLRDWNLRVILHRIWGERKLSYQSWAVMLNPQALDLRFWSKRDVEILNLMLEDYISGLNSHLLQLL